MAPRAQKPTHNCNSLSLPFQSRWWITDFEMMGFDRETIMKAHDAAIEHPDFSYAAAEAVLFGA